MQFGQGDGAVLNLCADLVAAGNRDRNGRAIYAGIGVNKGRKANCLLCAVLQLENQ